MLRNYFNIAWRNLQRNTVYSFINIGGLAVGMASAIIIFLWVWNEYSYDKSLINVDKLGRIIIHNSFSNGIETNGHAPLPAYEYLKSFDSRIKNTAISHEGSRTIVKAGNEIMFAESKFVSPEFLTMFQYPFLSGSATEALKDPNSIVITQSLAQMLFKDGEAIGKIVLLENKYEFKVAGVLKDLPKNSSFDFQMLLPWARYASTSWHLENNTWVTEPVQLFVELQNEKDFDDVNVALTNLIREKRGPENQSRMEVLKMEDWHLRSRFHQGKQTGELTGYMNAFSMIGAAILLIACINFMNLSTARSEKRCREVGVRKCMGSMRTDLIKQFLGESILITTIAFLIGILLVKMALPFFNNLTNRNISLDLSNYITWIISIGFIMVIGLLAGSYPSFYLSSFNPAKVLKGTLQVGKGSIMPRKILVTAQFFASTVLLIGTVVIYLQIQHVKNRDVGYDQDNLIMTGANEEMVHNLPEIKRSLEETGLVKSITTSNSPVTDVHKTNQIDWPGRYNGEAISFDRTIIGYRYAETMGIKILQGRDFSENFVSDSTAIIINKAALNAMAVENPIGMEVQLIPYERKWHIVGVFDDMVMQSPFGNVPPGFFTLAPDWVNDVTIRLNSSQNLSEALKSIETVFKKYNPNHPFEYTFVDDEFEKKFFIENIVTTLVTVFTLLSIIITCLGLFGLATYTAEQRTKEIGIRRVLGASALSILRLFTKEYSSLAIIGFVIAAPLAWLALSNYLNQFKYRIELDWWIIPVIGTTLFLIMLMIITSQVLKVLQVNPAETLRNE